MRQFFPSLSFKWKVLPFLIFWSTIQLAFAQNNQALEPVSNTYAITGANIVVSPGQKIDNGVILMKDGLITGVGKGLTIPSDAIVIKADSMFVYAGFIDGFSHTGVVLPKAEKKEKLKYPGNPPRERAGITPQNDVRDYFNPNDPSIGLLRNQGFTVSQVVPHGNFLPGQAAIVLLDGIEVDKMTLTSHAALYSELSGTRGVYPATVMGVMAKWRELYKQASLSKNYETMYVGNPNGIERPKTDRVLESFYPVIDRRQPVLFSSEKVIETQRVIALKNDLGFQLMLGNVKEGWPIIDKLKTSGAKIFLSLDLPEEIKISKKDSTSEDNTSEEKEALTKRKAESIALYTSQAASLSKAGITFGFSANTVKPNDIKANLRRMIAAGLSEDAVLAALTVNPAQMLGLSNRMGTIEKGKMANLVISDKSYFSENAKVKYVFVEGRLNSIGEPASNDKKAEVTGTWSYDTETPQGKGSGKLVIEKENNSYIGSITNNFSGQETSVKEIFINGNALSFSYVIDIDGNQLKINVTAEINGNSFDGSMTAGQYGTFPMKGVKDPK